MLEDQVRADGSYESPIESITIKFKDGSTRIIDRGYFLALEEPVEEDQTDFTAYMMLDDDAHRYLDLMNTLGEVQAQLAQMTHNLLHEDEGPL